jgi:hypothetical protein
MGIKSLMQNLGRKLKGYVFNPADLFIFGTIIIFCFLMLWYVLYIMMPDSIPRFW